MKEVFFALAALLVWFACYVVGAGILTFLSLAGATLLERYFLLQDRQTYPIWIIALSLCPLIAFVAGWTLGGLVMPEEFYETVRFGHLGAGVLFTVVAVFVVACLGEKEDRRSEIMTLAGSLLTDAACCAALVFFFDNIRRYMQSIGG
ncbi:MAG: hypothetical protein QGI33_04390 [Candidatus Brocadiia bacterium]|nr:hypothetical protein [Candidatus Brocadiia bacterium]